MSETFTSEVETLHLDSYDGPFFDNQIMKIDELAEYLKLSTKTIYRMALKGDIPSIRVGKSYRFLIPEVLRSLKSGASYGKRN